MPVKIKVCGITRYEDARTAVNLDVDAVGFIFYSRSPRFIMPEQARDIIRRLPPFVARVGVFVDEEAAVVMNIVTKTGVNVLQLHGNETSDYCAQFPLSTIKAFSIGPDFDLTVLDTYRVTGYLLDTWDKNAKGGSGRVFDWRIAEKACMGRDNVILAGGLGPSNVEEALRAVRPYAVDLNSGVEIRPGVKNPHKMREAVQIVRGWDATVQPPKTPRL